MNGYPLSEPRQLVTEITLNREMLMSSLHKDSESALGGLSLDAMRQILTDVSAHPVPYYNRHVHQEFTDWVITGRRCP